MYMKDLPQGGGPNRRPLLRPPPCGGSIPLSFHRKEGANLRPPPCGEPSHIPGPGAGTFVVFVFELLLLTGYPIRS